MRKLYGDSLVDMLSLREDEAILLSLDEAEGDFVHH